jgi:hypothetical protein
MMRLPAIVWNAARPHPKGRWLVILETFDEAKLSRDRDATSGLVERPVAGSNLPTR